jgi:hypothetical protein
MKERYLIFAYDSYDSAGGLGDIIATTNDLEDCERLYKKSGFEFGEVLDLQTGLTVLEFGD